MNRTGIAFVAVVVVGTLGLLWVSGAFVPYTAGPGYQPDVSPSPSPSPAAAGGGTPTGDTGTDAGAASPTASPTPSRYEHVTVTVYDANGTVLGEVRAAVADTPEKRYTGLSDTEFLPEDGGMLFTYGSEGNHTYVMREMDFGLDIVYVGSDGTIRTIHHAPEPPEGEDGNDYRYPGRGQYVLEVNLNWTTRNGVEEGDRVEIAGLDDT
ncbi:DUF192 domain-containing protein [Salinirubellus salinus]|uniref:DUF192 domain-containing protein n=1 Tax=Salinirubellus salinus TaxID=1364945 RepID=A0A9E7R1J7_9EURY|nr:DUF192 domain-containing protein [Salinirubellus salinus]UWM53906.1 DUF192 domain-containing protein [Salinirubellus salinus]